MLGTILGYSDRSNFDVDEGLGLVFHMGPLVVLTMVSLSK